MGSFKIRRLPLQKCTIETLEKQNLTSCKDVLSFTKLELQALLGISRNKVEEILREICKKCISNPQSAFDMYMKQRTTATNGFLPLSLHTVDLLLQGGLPFGSITEITGPPGVGKTQLCFMLSILTALPSQIGGLGAQAIYIDTESAFCAQRVKNMAEKKFPPLLKEQNTVQQVLQRVLVYKVDSVAVLKDIVLHLEKVIIQNNVKLIIVDSITSLMRKEFGTDSMQSLLERNQVLLEQAAALKDLAQTYNLVVFLTNQITSHMMEMDHLDDPRSEDEEAVDCNPLLKDAFHFTMQKKRTLPYDMVTDHIIPALGNTWSHCVNTRLVAQFLEPTVRQLIIVKSPIAPNAAVRYILDESGIVLLEDDLHLLNLSSRELQNIFTKNSYLTSEMTGTGMVFSGGRE